jgi:hypothetical protein
MAVGISKEKADPSGQKPACGMTVVVFLRDEKSQPNVILSRMAKRLSDCGVLEAHAETD